MRMAAARLSQRRAIALLGPDAQSGARGPAGGDFRHRLIDHPVILANRRK